ncbi:MAG: ATP-dependent DNA helicase UvrD2 [Candidatus Woesearchaeota archaeon]|nr:ATP-dependent DNA helicase UvrD2 [Candidatus Woesearchaeota archaeon]
MGQQDYLEILSALETLPFNMGKKSLFAVLQGETDNETVQKNKLHAEQAFGCLSGYATDELEDLFNTVKVNGFIGLTIIPGTRFRVYALTPKGKAELNNPTLKKINAQFTATDITTEDEKLFEAFDFFLQPYNQDQKKAIVSKARNILCVAGAGSGKTTVLTKRIEFLTKFCGVPREKILAITFTRKARQEMQRRLQNSVQVETFNSFCEQLLNKHGHHYYGKAVRVMQYKDKIRLLHHAIKKCGMDLPTVLQQYFKNKKQDKEQLARLFMHDVYSILDYYANQNKHLEDFSSGDLNAKLIYTICRSITQEMQEVGLRDYCDQLRDGLALIRKHPQLMPQYEHILVDEYQDVNTVQQQLLETLQPRNTFAVGDPRQSIFGWRGSKVEYILQFPADETIILQKNYRSKKEIVQLSNMSIKPMKLPDIEHVQPEAATVRMHSFKSDADEMKFVTEQIEKTTLPREEIFVLTRTNKQLHELADLCKARNIPFVQRSDEQKLMEAQVGQITLSTVHAIKGLEADMVFLIGCTSQYFPCKASDHPVLELVKRDVLDREEEELRLFYVALSRAKSTLHISHAGKATKFLTNDMRKFLGVSFNQTIASFKAQGANGGTFQKLREWRTSVSRKAGIPPYMIFPDKTLLELAEQQPNSEDELHAISGIGPAKAEKYGRELLGLLQ